MSKNRRLHIIFGVLLVSAILICLGIGTYTISVGEIIKVISGGGTQIQRMTVLDLRLPRIATGIAAGLALSLSGSLLQSLTKNELAEPGILGMNAGASLGVIMVINAGGTFYYNALSNFRLALIPFAAVAGSLLAALFIFLLSTRGGKLSKISLVLSGVGVNAGLNAVITFYQLRMSKGDYNQALTWISGSLWGSSWKYFIAAFPGIVIVMAYVVYKHKTLDIMDLGDELATGLGVPVERERKKLFGCAVILAAMATAVAGNLAFIGLLGPHIAKTLAGPSYKKHILLGAMISSFIVIVADTICRNAFSPLEIPAGIMISILGVPYFIYLMKKQA